MTGGQGRCTKRFVQTARKSAKFLSSPAGTVPFSAKSATQSEKIAVAKRGETGQRSASVFFLFREEKEDAAYTFLMNPKGSRLSRFKSSLFIFFLLFQFFLPSNYSSSEPVKIRVLFIGNSLTYVNDLPRMIAGLAKSRNFSLEYDSYAPGGYRLSQHASDVLLEEKINKGAWDFVVLQEQSQLPALSQEEVKSEVYPFAQRLSQSIRQANPRARVVFYMTMARRNGDAKNAKAFPEVATYAGMQRRINFSYTHMAQQNRGLLAPVGVVWQKVRLDRPAINLYADDTHPNIAGSYLAACVFYASFFKDTPVGLSHPKGIEDDTALYLQEMAEETIRSQSWDLQ